MTATNLFESNWDGDYYYFTAPYSGDAPVVAFAAAVPVGKKVTLTFKKQPRSWPILIVTRDGCRYLIFLNEGKKKRIHHDSVGRWLRFAHARNEAESILKDRGYTIVGVTKDA